MLIYSHSVVHPSLRRAASCHFFDVILVTCHEVFAHIYLIGGSVLKILISAYSNSSHTLPYLLSYFSELNKMVVSSLEGLSDAQKQELVASLSAIVVGSSGAEVSAEALSAVATASGNSLSGAWASVFASALEKVREIFV